MEPKRLFWPDLIRAVAILLVVVIHTSAPVVVSFSEVELSDWFFANSLDSLARVSVPLFFMISGYLVLNKDLSLYSIISRASKRILIPLLFWSIFYIAYATSEHGFDYLISYDFLSLLKNPAQYHLWFLYNILFLYLLIPLLKAIIEKNLSIYFISFCFIKEMVAFLPINIYWDFTPISSFSAYMVAGYYIGHMKPLTLKFKLVAGFVFLFFSAFTAIKTYYLSIDADGFIGKYYAYNSPNVMVMSFCLYFLLKDVDINFNFARKTISMVSMCALGIYGLHVLIIHLFSIGTFGVTSSVMAEGGSILSLVANIILVFTVSLIFIILARFVKPLRLVVG